MTQVEGAEDFRHEAVVSRTKRIGHEKLEVVQREVDRVETQRNEARDQASALQAATEAFAADWRMERKERKAVERALLDQKVEYEDKFLDLEDRTAAAWKP